MTEEKITAKFNDIEAFQVFIDDKEINITSFEIISKTIEDGYFENTTIKKYKTYHTVTIKTK